MTTTTINEVQEQIQKFWAPIFEKELRETTLFAGLVSKKYQGEIKAKGDTVKVSRIKDFAGQQRTIGTDADSFDTEAIQMEKREIKITERFVTATKFEDLIEIQSLVQSTDPTVRDAMLQGIRTKINNWLKTFIAPSAATPDHIKNGVSDFNKAELVALRQLAGTAKWPRDDSWYINCDPVFYGTLLNSTDLTSSDYVAESPVMNGRIGMKRFGFTILEDTSLSTQSAVAFHPSFLDLVQGNVRFKISDLHANQQFGFVMSVDLLAGALGGFDSKDLHATVDNL